jgi:molybdopterin converting factor small subunit
MVQRMRVKVSYLSILRDVTNSKEEELEVPEESTVENLIAILMDKYGEKLKPFLDPNSEMGQGIILTLNGELLSSSDFKRIIPPDSELLVGLPPFGG